VSAPLPVAGRIVSVRAGRVRPVDWPDATGRIRAQHTAYLKEPVAGPASVATLGIEGDEQYDQGHGGPDRALLAYPETHYEPWRRELGISDMGPGGFGENLTVTGFDEHTVCVGDVFEAGATRVQVSQPRGPCANISRRWGRPDLLQRVIDTRRFGWYLRVLETGTLAEGDAYRLVERPFPEWPVVRAFVVRHERAQRRDESALLAACPALSTLWREQLAALARP
jgi:MOSC domain-containing protein YiiM